MNEKNIVKKISLDKVGSELRDYCIESLVVSLNRKQVNMSHRVNEEMGVSMYSVSPKKKIGSFDEAKQNTAYFMDINSDEERRMSNLYRLYRKKELQNIKNIAVFGAVLALGGALFLNQNSPKGKVENDLWFHNINGFTASMERTVRALPDHECVIGGRGLEGVEEASNAIVIYMNENGYSDKKANNYTDKLTKDGKLDFIEEEKFRR